MQTVLHHGVAGLEVTLLHACAWNPVFDAQCEESRAGFIAEMVSHAGLGERAVEVIHTAEVERSPAATLWDRRHRAAVLAALARRAVPEARERLYGMLSREPGSPDVVGAEPIVELDGAAGLVVVARRLGAWLAEDPDFWASDQLLYDFGEGPGAARAVLDGVRAQEPSVERFLASLEARERREPRSVVGRAGRMEKMSAADVIALVRADPPDRCIWLSGYRPRDVRERGLVFDAMLEESDPARVTRFLRVFVRYGPPRFDERLLEWATSPDGEVNELATRVLAHVSHPRVRELAIGRLAAGDAPRGTVRLFQSTFSAGDHKWVEGALRADGSDDDVHWRLMEVIDVFEAHPVPEAAPSLCFVAEHTPCSHCRLIALRVLVALDALPEWMEDEARWDSSGEIRELVTVAGSV